MNIRKELKSGVAKWDAPLQSASSGSNEPLFEYHKLVFIRLLRQHSDRIETALHGYPLRVRGERLFSQMEVGQVLEGERAWQIFYNYLQDIEKELSDIIGRHSAFFWLHLYRRIGVRLSPLHDSNTDPTTLALVRRIGEAAIHKFGLLAVGDVKPSGRIHFKDLLGGCAKRIWENQIGSVGAKKLFSLLKTSNQWVMTDFSLSDYVAIYTIEGLAYEYWRCTAALRGIGKGDAIEVRRGEWPLYIRSQEREALLQYYDKEAHSFFNRSLLGTWFDVNRHPEEAKSLAPVPYFNVEAEGASSLLKDAGIDIHPQANVITNFLIGAIDIGGFYRAHLYLENHFHEATGLKLSALCMAVWGIALLAAGQSESLRNYGKDGEGSGLALLNFMQRGYSISGLSLKLCAELIFRCAEESRLSMPPAAQSEILACLEVLVLTHKGQQNISLWSGGPRFPILSLGDAHLFNSEGLAELLETLFFKIKYDQALRGSLFEEAFRAALLNRKIGIQQKGEIENLFGAKREIDAAVKVGGDLVIFECCSIERPLDFEIGRPITIQRRQERLSAKIDQVLSLVEFIRQHPKGKNYDFLWVENCTGIVVSPFNEWIWEKSERLWLEPLRIPRIMEAATAIDWLAAKIG